MSIVSDTVLPSSLVKQLNDACLPAGVVIRRNKHGKWVGYREVNCEKLERLGPFATKQAYLRIDFIDNSGMYNVDFGELEKLRIFDSLGVLSSGCHGPLTQVTLQESAKAAANIPTEATHFCFCYPPTGVATLTNKEKLNLEEHVARGDPEFTFLTFGGFAYFHGKKFLRANALVEGETGLTFEGPFPWKSEYTQYLYRQSRFEPITISALVEKGLQIYCFINPRESVISHYSTSGNWEPCPNGGFVYLYNADGSPHPFDCYFPVASVAQRIVSAEPKIRPFSVLEKIKVTDSSHHREYCCTVCLDRTIRCMLLPCKHLCVCAECAEELRRKTDFKCPMCRVVVNEVWDVYLTGAQE